MSSKKKTLFMIGNIARITVLFVILLTALIMASIIPPNKTSHLVLKTTSGQPQIFKGEEIIPLGKSSFTTTYEDVIFVKGEDFKAMLSEIMETNPKLIIPSE